VDQERLGPSYLFTPLVLGPLNSLVWCVPSLRYTRSLGWLMHCGAEVTESSTNKQHHLSCCCDTRGETARPSHSSSSPRSHSSSRVSSPRRTLSPPRRASRPPSGTSRPPLREATAAAAVPRRWFPVFCSDPSRLGIKPKTPGWLVQAQPPAHQGFLIPTIWGSGCVCVLLLQYLLQSCTRRGGGEWRTCVTRDYEPSPM
jgi:hypothetical protein